MKAILLLVFLLFTQATLATEQKINTISFEGKHYPFNLELSSGDYPVSAEKAGVILAGIPFSTGNWRRNPYVDYKIVDRELHVSTIHLDIDHLVHPEAPDDEHLSKPVTELLFPIGTSRLIKGITGEFCLTVTKHSSNVMYGDPCPEGNRILHFENSILIDVTRGKTQEKLAPQV
jgi:hypothetical protein